MSVNRSTALGAAFRQNPETARSELLAVVRACGGDLTRVAVEYGVTRRQVERIVVRESLWHLVLEARRDARAEQGNLDARTLRALGVEPWTS